MYRGINCTAVTPIPKIANPATIKEYMPIASYTVLCKIIAKILGGKIQKVIATIIIETQPGFIPGRKVDDNVIMAHESAKTYTRKHISPRCMIKVDIQKTYNSVDWRFLEQMRVELHFPQKFIRWVMECVRNVNYSIVINGEPTPPFDATRGL
ncbi:PREDICTED: uncharacterized protein LOC109220527 [Nicotiana attenuata]|uniref:uncharacterized protein LOC109220527 n=1 Tax=Nicotiana attenuata TaxID=49451 RepID=UPI000905D8CE|nr:PREDICTED: uncharacterized protein LOC109220527 [Nicotiana attenuata]